MGAKCGSDSVLWSPWLIPSARRGWADMAPRNKCLAQSNKSAGGAKATKTQDSQKRSGRLPTRQTISIMKFGVHR